MRITLMKSSEPAMETIHAFLISQIQLIPYLTELMMQKEFAAKKPKFLSKFHVNCLNHI